MYYKSMQDAFITRVLLPELHDISQYKEHDKQYFVSLNFNYRNNGIMALYSPKFFFGKTHLSSLHCLF